MVINGTTAVSDTAGQWKWGTGLPGAEAPCLGEGPVQVDGPPCCLQLPSGPRGLTLATAALSPFGGM